MHQTPKFQEDHSSQIPAIQFLQNLGYTYLTPVEALLERNKDNQSVILEHILETQLKKINSFEYKGEPIVPQVELFFKHLLEVYEKLKALGFTYYQDRVIVIEVDDGVEGSS